MTSRGKRIVLLALQKGECITECYSTSAATAIQPEINDNNNIMNDAGPSCTPQDQMSGEDSGDCIENELESLFGDISDNNDPTYCLPNSNLGSDSDDSIIENSSILTSEDLLGNNVEKQAQPYSRQLQVASFQENIENLVEEGDQQSESVDIVEQVLHELLNKAWKIIKPLKRWRKADPSSWAYNVAKKRRADGLSYKIRSKKRPAKVPKKVDCSTCQFQCTELISDTHRKELCRQYWNLDFKGRKNFILVNISIQPPKRVLAVRNQRPQRSYTKKCFFSKENVRVQVCQNFFCKTLCIAPAVIVDAIKKRNNLLNCFDENDHRGAHEPVNKTKTEILQGIRSHIESFPCMDAHYSRKDTQRKYLDKDLSIRKMYFMYKELCSQNGTQSASEITYRRIFANEYNLSFFLPRKDQCLTCTTYSNAELEKKTELEDNYRAHQERKKQCNAEKEHDKDRSNNDPHFNSITFDLQGVLQIPSCDVSLLYYSRKLCVYNLTIYEAALPNNAYCFTWSEVNGKKGSSEIGTILLYYLSNCVPSTVSEISLFADTCSGQNRNQFVSALLLWSVQKIDHLQVIEQKFLESGHSQMEADSMHSSIESAKKHTSVYSMVDWISIFQRARRKKTLKLNGKKVTREQYNVKEFKHSEFFDLKDLANKIMKNRTKDEKGNQVKWLKIKRMKYVKGERKIFFNYDMSENFNFIDITGDCIPPISYSTRARNRRPTEALNVLEPSQRQFPEHLTQLYHHPLPISEAKQKDLINLCKKGVIPEELHGWFENLKTDKNVGDSLPEAAVDEQFSTESDAE